MEVLKAATLYLVPTPIGNLSEISPRVNAVLTGVDKVYCENTTTALRMLNYLGIKQKLFSYHKYNEKNMVNTIINDLQNNLKIALMSEAGHPLISDPGFIVVNSILNEGFKVSPLSGSCAFLSAIICSGFNSQAFLFVGFLPKGPKQRQIKLQQLVSPNHIVAIYESKYRILDLIKEINKLFPTIRLCVAKELTKLNETFWRGTSQQILEQIVNMPLKGEYCVVIDRLLTTTDSGDINKRIIKAVQDLINSGWSKKTATLFIANLLEINYHHLYKLIIKLSQD